MTNFKKSLLGAICASMVVVVPAGAATTVGNLTYTATDTMESCTDRLYVGESAEYKALAPGIVTQFTVKPGDPGGTAQLAIVNDAVALTPVTVRGLSAKQSVTAATQSFLTRVPIAAGDYVGVWGGGGFKCEASVMPGQGLSAYADSANLTVGFSAPRNPVSNKRPIVTARVEADADGDGFGDETQDGCKGQNGPNNGCVVPTCLVPKLKGLTRTNAKAALTKGGCKLGTVKKKKLRKFTKTQKRNRVRTQSIKAGTFRPGGTAVNITINVKKKK